MRLTAFTDFALRALDAARRRAERSFTTEEIAREFAISRHHLTKVVRELASGGFVATNRGPAAASGLPVLPGRSRLARSCARSRRDMRSSNAFEPTAAPASSPRLPPEEQARERCSCLHRGTRPDDACRMRLPAASGAAHGEREIRPAATGIRMREGMRLLWLALGLGATACAIAGVLLPLMPTTPFLLLAAYAFARSSPALHEWIVTHPRLGPPIMDWRAHGAIARRTKAIAVAAMLLALLGSWIAGFGAPLLLLQTAVLSGSTVHPDAARRGKPTQTRLIWTRSRSRARSTFSQSSIGSEASRW